MLEFRHKAFYGTTGMGKTWCLKRIAQVLIKNKQKVIVYSASGDLGFPKGCMITDNVDQLHEWLLDRKNWGSFVILDEAADIYEETTPKLHPFLWRITRRGRHQGYTVYVATQFPTLIPTRIRRLCSEVYAWRQDDAESAETIWRDWARANYGGEPIRDILLKLPKLQFLHMVKPQEIELKTL